MCLPRRQAKPLARSIERVSFLHSRPGRHFAAPTSNVFGRFPCDLLGKFLIHFFCFLWELPCAAICVIQVLQEMSLYLHKLSWSQLGQRPKRTSIPLYVLCLSLKSSSLFHKEIGSSLIMNENRSSLLTTPVLNYLCFVLWFGKLS